MNTIPDELLTRILGNLDVYNLNLISAVQKRWKAVIENEVWRIKLKRKWRSSYKDLQKQGDQN
jgi:hypothetical protein